MGGGSRSGSLEEDDERVVLRAEDGEEIVFDVLGTLEVEGKEYALLTPAGLADSPEGIDVHIFAYERKADGTEEFTEPNDEAYEKVRSAAEAMLAGADGEEDLSH